MPIKQPDDKQPFEELYGKPLTQEELKEMKHNLASYVQLLIKLDRQHKAWLKGRKTSKSGDEKTSP